ncbi:MAG TPA: amidase [Gemmatimonadaceae bacterium]|nr:amidase [Gemmatimonadaceae bacterium]
MTDVRKKSPDECTSLPRRAFLGAGALAVAGLAFPGSAAATTPVVRRSPITPSGPALEEATFADLAESMKSGRLTSRSIVQAYLANIEATDRSGPTLHSVLEVNPDALAIADALDLERREKGPRGPLHGIPILVKDDIGTADRMHTSAGSRALAESIAPRDAFVVQRLREAGCVILGKTNMSEWANARGRGAPGGWSGRGHLTRNPYVLDRSTGGSSSGTAAAVSANLAAAALGSEAMGSIVTPASLCGVVGLKPTVGLVSRAGTITISRSQSTIGPVCRTVRDTAILLSVIAGPDPRDPATDSSASFDYAADLDAKALATARIGVARNYSGISLHADRVTDRAIEAMRSAGATVVDVEIETADALWTFDSELLSYELKAGINEYLASLGPKSPVRTLADVIEYNNRHSDQELERFGQETFIYAQSKRGLDSPEYRNHLTLVRKLARDDGIDATLRKNRLDAIVAPTQSPAWLTDLLLGDNSLLTSFIPAAVAGYPSITVPAGNVVGLPVGLSFMGTAWSEARLLSLAFSFEQAVKARRPPQFLREIPAPM